MATIYEKAAEKTVILSPREGFQRAFDFGSTWTEIRIGMYFSGVTAAGDNTTAVAEDVAVSSVDDRIAFGLKNSDTTGFPGTAGTLFVGAGNLAASTFSRSNGSQFYGDGGNLSGIGWAGVTAVSGAGSLGALLAYGAAGGATAYCDFAALKFVLTDRGLSTQSFAITAAFYAEAGSDYSPSALRTDMNNATYGGSQTVAWNTGAAARVIPDAFYLRLPFYNNRIRVSCMRMAKYA